MGKLKAEEALVATSTAVHPFMDASDQRTRISKLEAAADLAEPPRKPTRAELAGIGINVIGQEQDG